MTLTVQSLAAKMSRAFEGDKRPSSGESFRKLKDGSPGWMSAVCRKAHDDGEMLPDDWRYAFIEEAVDALAEHGDADEARDSLEPDTYTSDLTAWLHGSSSRVHYLGEVIEEYGPFRDGFRLLATAQWREKLKTFDQVLSALQEELDGRDGSDESDEAEEA